MNEKEVEKSLQAMEAAGKEVTASPEAAKQFLQKIGFLDDKGNIKPLFQDNVEPLSQSAQSSARISRMR